LSVRVAALPYRVFSSQDGGRSWKICRSEQIDVRTKTDAMPDQPPQWFDPKADNPPWIKALADVRRQATLQGYCYHHVQAIIVAIDQYAEAALGNREYFLNRPHRTG
jgi:hypothetical protein